MGGSLRIHEEIFQSIFSLILEIVENRHSIQQGGDSTAIIHNKKASVSRNFLTKRYIIGWDL